MVASYGPIIQTRLLGNIVIPRIHVLHPTSAHATVYLSVIEDRLEAVSDLDNMFVNFVVCTA